MANEKSNNERFSADASEMGVGLGPDTALRFISMTLLDQLRGAGHTDEEIYHLLPMDGDIAYVESDLTSRISDPTNIDGKEEREATKETVRSVADQVADGTMDATTAGQKIRTLISTLKPSHLLTIEERRERYHEAAIETDDNSFIHVEVLKDAGKISPQQYAAIRNAMNT